MLLKLLITFTLAANSFNSIGAYYDRARYREICKNDNTNDDAIHMNAQQLIVRSGFEYEEYYSIADDGYITQLIRLVNPLADRSALKGPPVMLFHGANIDQSAFLISSSIQHWPEEFPRFEGTGSIGGELFRTRSSNRSLAFTLANNGYDVWLIGQRGSNKNNLAYSTNVHHVRRLGLQFSPDEMMSAFSKTKSYWLYGLDEIISYEIKHQIDLVKRVTKSKEVSIFAFSLSAPTTMAFLAANKEYAQTTRVYIQMAPAIAADHLYTIGKIYFEKLCPILPTRGIGFTPTFWIKPAVRKLTIVLSKFINLRYGVVLDFVRSLFGPSQKYNTNLERNILAHVFQLVSFKSIQHYCKNSLDKQLTKFNYGKEKNLLKYNSPKPPVYDISELNVQNWIVVSGTNDGLADTTTVQRLIEKTKTPKPMVHIIAPGFNHLDMLAAVEVDNYVNLPVVKELNKHSDYY